MQVITEDSFMWRNHLFATARCGKTCVMLFGRISSAGPPLLRRSLGGQVPSSRYLADRGMPPQQEKVAAAKTAPKTLKEPIESCLNGVSGVYASEIDRSAIRTTSGEQPSHEADHDRASPIRILSKTGANIKLRPVPQTR
jgi:hypothetical protein